MRSFAKIEAEAAKHHGGKAALESKLSIPLTSAKLKKTSDDRWLSAATKCIFQAGFNWQLIEDKWPNFERAFDGFDLHRWAMMSDEDLDRLLKADGIVANGQKLRSVGENARYLLALAAESGSVGAQFAGWKLKDYVANVHDMQARGSRLGGRTGPLFLRRMGVDALIFSPDVIKAFAREGIVKKAPSSKKEQAAVQDALDIWHKESGRGLTQMSQILAYSVGRSS